MLAVWSEIKRSLVTEAAGRIDSNFYNPIYLATNNIISKLPNESLGTIIQHLSDYHSNGSYRTLRENVSMSDSPSYAYMIRTTDFENDDFESEVKYVNEHAYNFLSKSKLFGGEVIINKIGSAGSVYIMPTLNRPCSLGMNQFALHIAQDINPYFIYAYLKSNYGRKLIEQQINGTVPFTITKNAVRSVKIFLPSLEIRQIVGSFILKSLDLKKQSKSLYSQAQSLLEKELGLDKVEFAKNKTHSAFFSETLLNNRSDADFYQLKYRQLEEHLSTLTTKSLLQLASLNKGIEVGSSLYCDSGVLFIRVSNLSTKGFTPTGSDKYISTYTYENLKVYSPKINDILLTKDGSAGICYNVSEDIEGIISGGIVKLDLIDKTIPNEYLALVINSKICQMQIERDCSGALILHWKPEQIRKLKIPILDKTIMIELADMVTKSKEAKKESEQLLSSAIKQVEHLIETEAAKNN